MKTRPQGASETLATKPTCTFSLKTPPEIQEEKGTLVVSSLSVFIGFSVKLSKTLD